MDIVRVNVQTTPPLLADLISAVLDAEPVRAWRPGDAPADVTITNRLTAQTQSPLTIVLGDRLDDPISVVVDGKRSSVAPMQLEGLHALVLDLVRGAIGREQVEAHERSAGSAG